MVEKKQLTLFISYARTDRRERADELLRFLTRFEKDKRVSPFDGAAVPCLLTAYRSPDEMEASEPQSTGSNQPWSMDECLAPVLDWVKCTAAPATRLNASRARYLVFVENLTRHAARAGCGGYLAWTAGELLDRGVSSARVGLRIIEVLAESDPDDATAAVIALLPDLHGKAASRFSSFSKALRPECVVTVGTVLKRAEAAMQEGNLLETWQIPPACDDLLYWTREESPLVRLVSLGGLQLVVEHACDVIQKRSEAGAFELVRVLMTWLTDEPPDLRSGEGFVISRLLQPLWLNFPGDAANASAALFERAPDSIRLAFLAAAVEALERELAARKQLEVPRFEFLESYVRYAAPKDDPWPNFGDVVARAATRDERLRAVLRACNERLRAPRPKKKRKGGQQQITDE